MPDSFIDGNLMVVETRSIDVKDLRNQSDFKPTIENNGFTLVKFDNRQLPAVFALLDSLKNAALSFKPLISYVDVEKAIEQDKPGFEDVVLEWGKNNLKDKSFDRVICLMPSYRDTKNARSANAISAFHIDFSDQIVLSFMFESLGVDKDFRKKIGQQVTEWDYWKPGRLVTALNFWLPLFEVNSSPLAVMDKNSTGPIFKAFAQAPELENRLFALAAPKYSKDQRIYYYSKMARGEALVFDTFKTPHSAFNLPGESGSRQSVDIRCFFINSNLP